MLRRIAVASLGLLLAAPPGRAQDLATLCRAVMQPPVGAWSEFRMEGGRTAGSSMRMAVVGQETRGGTHYLWMEFAAHGVPMGGAEGGGDTVSMINKVLVRGFGAEMAEPAAMVMKIGSAPAMEMPTGGGPEAPGSNSLKDCTSSRVVGWESVTVPAGTFRALHVQDPDGGGDTWVVPDLPFGMVQALEGEEPGDSGRMVLVAHGMGARSAIVETPRPFDQAAFMQLMQQMMRQRQDH
jgi:hypothetical protein